MFSLSPRHHGRSTLDNVSNTNTSSTDNSNNNLSTSSRDTAIHNVMVGTKQTDIGAISAALPVMLCGLTVNNIMPKVQSTQANEPKNSVDDNAEQKINVAANLGTEIKSFSAKRNLNFVCFTFFALKFTIEF